MRYGLKISRAASWNPGTLIWYQIQKMKGEKLYQIDGDPNQLGGDFIIDYRGRCVLPHRSKIPNDRPSIEIILRNLEKIERSRDLPVYVKNLLPVVGKKESPPGEDEPKEECGE